MTEPTADPSTDTMIVPIVVDRQPSGLLRELNALLESLLSVAPLSAAGTTLTEFRLDGDGWPHTVVAAAGNAAAVEAAAVGAPHIDGNKQPHYYVSIHITAVHG